MIKSTFTLLFAIFFLFAFTYSFPSLARADMARPKWFTAGERCPFLQTMVSCTYRNKSVGDDGMLIPGGECKEYANDPRYVYFKAHDYPPLRGIEGEPMEGGGYAAYCYKPTSFTDWLLSPFTIWTVVVFMVVLVSLYNLRKMRTTYHDNK